MAPRVVKNKKAEDDAPTKGKNKTKIVEEDDNDLVIKDKLENIIEKKTNKRAKKRSNEQVEMNGASEDVVPPVKKGRKQKEKHIDALVSEETEIENGHNKNKNNKIDDEVIQDNAEETQSTGKGRKKQIKKEVTVDKTNIDENTKAKESGKGKKKGKQQSEPMIDVTGKEVGKGKKKTAHENGDHIVEKEPIEKSKSAGKSRGRKAKADKGSEVELDEEEEKIEKPDPPAAKGKKRVQDKTPKEKMLKSNKEMTPEDEESEIVEKKNKKETKSRKGKKAPVEDIENQEEIEAPASNKRKNNDNKEKTKDETRQEAEAKPVKSKKGQKKVEAPVESKDENAEKDEPMEEEVPKSKGRGKRGQKKEEVTDELQEEQDSGEPATKKRRKPTEDKAPIEDAKKKAPLKNKATTNYEELDFSNTSKNQLEKEWNFKISSWNVDGIRAWLGKGGLDYIKYEKPNILCLQETKCSQDKFPEEIANLPGYHAYWLSGDQEGYAGVGIYTKKLAIHVEYGLKNEELDTEGRIITAEYEQFYLICTYVPNAGRKLVTLPKRLQWNEEFRKYVKELDKKKPVIICGDMNVAHNEIDLANPKTNKKNAGFTEEERAGMTELLGEGFVDTYRHMYPDNTGAYTFWTYMLNSRAKNVGWRLDYFIVSERLLPSICDSVIRSGVYGSDHCPISLFLHLTTADKPKE